MIPRTSFPTIPIRQVPAEESPEDDLKDRPVVLVVDDERVIADTLSSILAFHGYAPLTAYDGNAALELARLIPPDLLITDVVMPEMNGIDLALRVRHGAPDCEIILFSGHAVTVPLLASAGSAGRAFEVLSKPLHPAAMLERVAACLRAHALADLRALEGSGDGSTERHRMFRSSRHTMAASWRNPIHSW